MHIGVRLLIPMCTMTISREGYNYYSNPLLVTDRLDRTSGMVHHSEASLSESFIKSDPRVGDHTC